MRPPLVDSVVAAMEKSTGVARGYRRAPLVFDPIGVVPGLALSDEPPLRFRAAVYRESNSRRRHETRAGAAPADMGQ